MATSPSRAEAADPVAPQDSGRVRLGGHSLYWERHGPGAAPALVLLHEGLGSTHSWVRQVPAWAGAGWQVVAYDRWGYGQSDRRPDWPTDFLARDADEAVELLNALGLETVRLIGHSDGGTLALMLAAAHPQRVAGMVLVAAHIERETRTQAGLHRLRRAAQAGSLDSLMQQHHGEKGRELAEAWIDRWLDPAMEDLSLASSLKDIRCPTLVIQGELDEHASRQHAQRIADGIALSELWLIPGVGHMPTREAPDLFNGRVLGFLGSPSAQLGGALVESDPVPAATSWGKDRSHA